MTNEESRSIISRLAEVATLAGINGKVDNNGECFVTGCAFPDGRSQGVYMRSIETPSGAGVCVYSPAASYKKGIFGGIGKDAAIELLKRNEKLFFARFGIREMSEELLVVASADVLIDTLDPEELRSAMGSVAAAADTWEELTGKEDRY